MVSTQLCKRVIPFSQFSVISLVIIIHQPQHVLFITCTGIISLLPGMAALLHLKVMRVSDDDPTRSDENNIVFSDVPLGQTKV